MPLNNKKSFIICIALLGSLCLNAQFEPLYSMYAMNGFLFNPAIAGSDGYTTVGLAARDHMLGFENSPKTYVLSVQGRLLRRNVKVKKNFFSGDEEISKRSGRVGLGAYIFNDRNGYIERTGGNFTYAYHIFMQNTQLSFGLRASIFQFKLDQSKLVFSNNQGPEPLMNQGLSNQMLVPDMSFGTYLLSPTSFLGLSVTNLFQTRIPLGTASYDYRMLRTYFLMGGKRFNDEDIISYEPSFLFMATEKMLFQADFQMRFIYNHDYYMGISYRAGSAVGILIGARLNKINFGYAFDYGLTSIQKYTYGAHEINIALKFGDNARRYKWLIRY
jgi:type IX secretion system PorP/SprF family membrane protein